MAINTIPMAILLQEYKRLGDRKNTLSEEYKYSMGEERMRLLEEIRGVIAGQTICSTTIANRLIEANGTELFYENREKERGSRIVLKPIPLQVEKLH